MTKYHVERVGIETPLEAYAHGRGVKAGEGARRDITIYLIAVSRLAGRLEERAKVLGLPVVVNDADHVRRALGIRGQTRPERDAAVKAYLLACVARWPTSSNVDERDGAAMAIYAARSATNGAFGKDGRSSAIRVNPNPRMASRSAGKSKPPVI